MSRLIVALVASLIWAFTSSALAETAVPTGVPVVGDYTGALRPQIHYSPPKDFMNDPNGMFLDSNGTYHLYYQYNPTATVAGNQHWGHATSRDLYHWINQPIALFPVNASSFIFSGSAVVDVNNTSGFFPKQDNGVVAIFTIATYEPILLQSQGIAYSYDGGYTFKMFKHNPVLDVGSSQFRDPKVLWYQDHWVMVVSYASDYVIGFFTSTDLKEWAFASNFTHHGLLGIQYECPNLVEVPLDDSDETMWILQISINPGAPLGGSIAQYFPGTFDGYKFRKHDGVARIADFGKDNYAGQFFYGTPSGSDAISIGWASNWEYAQVVPTGNLENWRSAMGVPRRQSLRRVNSNRDLALVSRPYDLSSILGKTVLSRTVGNDTVAVDYSTVYSGALYFEATIPAYTTAGSLNFTFSSPVSGEYLQMGVVMGVSQPIWINRGGIRGFDNPFFTDKFSAHTVDGITQVSGIIDRSILEVFANDGEISATNTFFPTQPLSLMTLGVSGLLPSNSSVKARVYELKSTWKDYENDSGKVVGNRTMSSKSGPLLARTHPRMLYEPKLR